MNDSRGLASGFTLRSVAASLVALLMTAIVIQQIAVTDEWSIAIGGEPLPIPGLMSFLAVALVAAAVWAATRCRLLTRAEMVCVLFSVLIAAPLMSDGFWRMMLAISNTVTRRAQFDKYDAMPPKLWPHGANLLASAFTPAERDGFRTQGAVKWTALRTGDGPPRPGVSLASTNEDGLAWVRITVPVRNGAARVLRLGQPYFLSTLARARHLGPGAFFYCRVYYDDDGAFSEEAFTSSKIAPRTYLQKTGFGREAAYGVVFPAGLRKGVVLELGLSGSGTLDLCDPQLIDVAALEAAFRGRKIVSRAEYDRMAPSARDGLIVKPDHLWSREGLRFLLQGYVPVRAWVRPIAAWTLFTCLLLAATFALAVVMRRQWLENERYPLPMAQVPIALMEGDEKGGPAPIWKNRWMWGGFAFMLFWCLMRGWHSYNASVPDLSVDVNLKSYFPEAGWGKTWDGVDFRLSALYLSFGLFMELNVLASLAVGFLLFRLQYAVGSAYGWDVNPAFPCPEEQRIGAYLAYAALIVFFARRYLWRRLKQAVAGARDPDDPISMRGALLILTGCFAGVVLWARWMGLPTAGMALFLLFLVAVGLVATKLRAECGVPGAAFVPSAGGDLAMIPLLGGVGLLGSSGLVFVVFATILYLSRGFFHIPGLQLELMEVGRRAGVRPRQLTYIAILGVLGGILVGGWVYLSTAYAIGADNYPIATGQFATAGNWKVYNTQMSEATDRYVTHVGAKAESAAAGGGGADSGESRSRSRPGYWGYAFGAAATAALVVLRQLFAGFWFHPIGFVLGTSGLASDAWGSLLLAALVRLTVLKIGGAVTVRTRLFPFAVGMVLGMVAAYAVFTLIHGYMYFYVPGVLKPRMTF